LSYTSSFPQIRPLTSDYSVINSPCSVAAKCTALPLKRFTARSEARYWLRIAISAYHTCIRRPHWGEGCRRILPCHLVRKNQIEGTFIRFDRMYERDRHTDRRTDRRIPHDGQGRACTTARGKNLLNSVSVGTVCNVKHVPTFVFVTRLLPCR